MSFVDLDSVLVPSSGAVGSVAWGRQVADNVAYLGGLVSTPWRLWVANWLTVTAIGNGSVAAEVWKQGREVRARAMWIMGSTTAYSGVSNPGITLPHLGVAGPIVIGSAFMTDASTGAVRTGTVVMASTGASCAVGVFGAASPGQAVHNVPWTWATGDTMSVDLCYRSAA